MVSRFGLFVSFFQNKYNLIFNIKNFVEYNYISIYFSIRYTSRPLNTHKHTLNKIPPKKHDNRLPPFSCPISEMQTREQRWTTKKYCVTINSKHNTQIHYLSFRINSTNSRVQFQSLHSSRVAYIPPIQKHKNGVGRTSHIVLLYIVFLV